MSPTVFKFGYTYFPLTLLNSVKCAKENSSVIGLARDVTDHYGLRQNFNLNIPKHRLSTVANSPLILPIKLYNKLPTVLKQISASRKFLKAVKQFFYSKRFYSVQEYLDCNT